MKLEMIFSQRSRKGISYYLINICLGTNSKDLETCPYIATDESYLIFSRFDNFGPKYYISYKDKTGKWFPPVFLDEELQGVSPKISPDGKYFFFNGGGIYWMPAKFIEELRPKE